MGRPPRPALERFQSMVSVGPGCWEWVAAKDRDGYGQFKGNGHVRAHRFSYDEFVGPIPEGLQVLHRCDNPSCVNPEHLWVGTNADNMADKCEKGRLDIRSAYTASAAARSAKTHCLRGHPLDGDNLYVTARGSRSCKTCRRAANRKWENRGNEGS
jgi:hypothetical protein